MSLKQLSTGEMIALSTPWVTPGPVRQALEALAEARPVLPHLDAAHRALLDTRPSPESPELGGLADEAARLDACHDTQISGIYALLSGLALLTSDNSRAQALLGLRDRLFPDGLFVARRSYRDEAGLAERFRERLTPGDLALLGALPVGAGTLADAVDVWQGIGRGLGEVEARRQALLAEQRLGDGDTIGARNQWLRAANALVAAVELAQVDAQTRLALVGELDARSSRAERRPREPMGGADA